MNLCHTQIDQHLATNSQDQGHNFDSNFKSVQAQNYNRVSQIHYKFASLLPITWMCVTCTRLVATRLTVPHLCVLLKEEYLLVQQKGMISFGDLDQVTRVINILSALYLNELDQTGTYAFLGEP